MDTDYREIEPLRADIDAFAGPLLLEFGTPWCPHCQAAQAPTAEALAAHPQVRRIRVEDGPGRPLGRSFRVKLWPTLIFLNDGKEIERLVRPTEASAIEQALGKIGSAREP
jgi:thioredoxin 1